MVLRWGPTALAIGSVRPSVSVSFHSVSSVLN